VLATQKEVANNMKSDFLIALTQLAAERNLPREIVLSAIEAALVSAYKKDSIMAGQNISVKLDPGSGSVSVFVVKTVVDEIADAQQEILLKDALNIRDNIKIGDVVPTGEIPSTAGRIAAQTAKQVVMQRLREAEREIILEEFQDKEGEIFSATVQRVEPKHLIVDLGRTEAILPASEQVLTERYRVGQKFKVLLQVVQKSSKGPELIVSRADSLFLRRIFEMEVPEIYNGSVEIMAIAREAGARSKVAVRAIQEGVDPVGSCVGLRGVRIQNVVNELQGEKIDVMEWSDDVEKFIANALSPSQVLRVELNETLQLATAIVPDRQLSLAIGREGQNARLAAKLAGWRVDIKSNVQAETESKGISDGKNARKGKPKASEVAGAVQAENVEEGIEELVSSVPVVEEVQDSGQEIEMAELEIKVDDEKIDDDVIISGTEPGGDELGQSAVEPAETSEGDLSQNLEEDGTDKGPVEDSVHTTSLRDLPEGVWSVRRAGGMESGQIRFAEDIAGLRGGVSRNSPKQNEGNQNQPAKKRKTKAGKKRR